MVPGLHIPKPWAGWLGLPLWIGVFGSILSGTPCLPASPLPYTHGLANVWQPALGKRKSQIPWPVSSYPYNVNWLAKLENVTIGTLRVDVSWLHPH